MIKQKKSHVKIGDKIKIITGDQKGLVGKILSINKKKETAIIDGVVPRIKYVKSTTGENATKTEKPLNIAVSNLMLWDENSNKSSRIGYKIINDQKQRYFKKSGNNL